MKLYHPYYLSAPESGLIPPVFNLRRSHRLAQFHWSHAKEASPFLNLLSPPTDCSK